MPLFFFKISWHIETICIISNWEGAFKKALVLEYAIKKAIESVYRNKDIGVGKQEWISIREMGEKVINFLK